jgi:hypothetical protein
MIIFSTNCTWIIEYQHVEIKFGSVPYAIYKINIKWIMNTSV